LAALVRYITIIYTLHNRLTADFQSGAAGFKEVLPWSLTKPHLDGHWPLAFLKKIKTGATFSEDSRNVMFSLINIQYENT